MGLLEKIIFLADYIEPNRRDLPGLDQIRKMAFSDLDQAVYLVLEDTIEYLNGLENREIDGRTLECYQFYKKAVLDEK